METKRKALGKGLEQLFSNEIINFDDLEKDIINETPKKDITEVNLSEIRSNPYQPRKVFDPKTLEDLANSIKEYGVIEPIIVKKTVKGYELIAGERRCKAAKLAGLETIPAVIKDFNDKEMMEIALLENIQREDLNPIDEAEAYSKIIEIGGLTQEEFARKFGKSRSHVTNMLGLLSLSSYVKDLVRDKKITMGHARALSKLSDEDKIKVLADKVVAHDLSVRELEKMIADSDLPRKEPQYRAHEFRSVKSSIYEKIMREKVGTKVKIGPKKIEIPFDSEMDLERILDILGVSVEDSSYDL